MKRAVWMAAALTLAAASASGAAWAQDNHDDHHDERAAPHEGAQHTLPQQQYHAPPAARTGEFHAGPVVARGPVQGHFDGFQGQGFGLHGRAQFVYQGRSFSSFRAAPFLYPHGWGYRPWNRGQFLPGLFLSQGYFIGNWGGYGLAPPPYGCQWVRYGPDALLVNVYSGQIIDVVHGVFWW